MHASRRQALLVRRTAGTPRSRVGVLGFVLVVGSVAPPALADVVFPAAARAALSISPRRAQTQPIVDRAFALQVLLDLFEAPVVLGERVEGFTLYTLHTDTDASLMGVTRARTRLAADFENMRGTRTGSVGGHALYTYRSGAGGRLALVGRREIVEGREDALRLGLQVQASGGRAKARRDLERSLLRLEDPGGAASLVYLAPSDGASVVQIVSDLGAIWGPYLSQSIEPYETVLGLLGSMRAARADVWQEGDDLGVRIVLVASDAGAAKRAHLALRTARGLAPMVSKAAVRSGSMAQSDADVLNDVLDGMQSHVEDDRIVVVFQVPGSIVR